MDARGNQPFRGSRRFREPHQSARCQQTGAGKPRGGRRFRCLGRKPCKSFAGVEACWRRHNASTMQSAAVPSSFLSAAAATPGSASAASRGGLAPGRAAAEGIRFDRLLSDRPPARRLRRRAQTYASAILGGVCARGAHGRKFGSRGRDCGHTDRAAHAPGKQDGNCRGCRIQLGSTRQSSFPKACNSSGICSSQARRCCSRSRPSCREMTCAHASRREPLDQAAAKLSRGLRIFLRAEAPVESVAKRLENRPAARDRGEARSRSSSCSRRAPRSRSSSPGASKFPLRLPVPLRRSQG